MSNYTNYGHFHASKSGQCFDYLRLPDANGDLQNFLTWGYGVTPAPNTGSTILSESVFEDRYGVPRHARAIRVHVKVKAKTIQWAANAPIADLQLAINAEGASQSSNECTHAFVTKTAEYDYSVSGGNIIKTPANPTGSTEPATEDINSIVVDVPLGLGGHIKVFTYPTIIRDYANIDLGIYLAGYWA